MRILFGVSSLLLLTVALAGCEPIDPGAFGSQDLLAQDMSECLTVKCVNGWMVVDGDDLKTIHSNLKELEQLNNGSLGTIYRAVPTTLGNRIYLRVPFTIRSQGHLNRAVNLIESETRGRVESIETIPEWYDNPNRGRTLQFRLEGQQGGANDFG